MREHPMYFIPAAAKAKADWRGCAPAKVLSRTLEACTVELPVATEPGSFKIACEDCAAWALVTVRHQRDDPRSFTMPCGRILLWDEPSSFPSTATHNPHQESTR